MDLDRAYRRDKLGPREGAGPVGYPDEGIGLPTECLLIHRPLVVRQAHHERTTPAQS